MNLKYSHFSHDVWLLFLYMAFDMWKGQVFYKDLNFCMKSNYSLFVFLLLYAM